MRKRRQYERIRLFYFSQIRGILNIERIPHWSGITPFGRKAGRK